VPGIVLDPETKMVDHTDSVSTVLGPTVQWESQDLEMARVSGVLASVRLKWEQ